jgi:hypothetical protein
VSQLAPVDTQPQVPPVRQAPKQQSASAVQASPSSTQHVPFWQVAPQQRSFAHAEPSGRQHCPSQSSPLQQSAGASHGMFATRQQVSSLPQSMPPQQPSSLQLSPKSTQQLPRPSQRPSQHGTSMLQVSVAPAQGVHSPSAQTEPGQHSVPSPQRPPAA